MFDISAKVGAAYAVWNLYIHKQVDKIVISKGLKFEDTDDDESEEYKLTAPSDYYRVEGPRRGPGPQFPDWVEVYRDNKED